jgi:peptidyl-prolyl cis-trans isomerase D
MLKIMRGHKFFSVFLLTVITVMIIISFVFWGIGPQDNPATTFAAQVEDIKITLDEYWRTYDNEYKRLRDQDTSPEEIEKLNLKDSILNALINRTVLLIAAEKAGITVIQSELQEAISNTPYFQRNGVFDQNVYKRALKLSRTTPSMFENSLRNDMVITKMRQLIEETAELSSEELKIIDSMKGGNREQLTEIFRSTKSNQAVQSYIESIKRQLEITVNQDIVS